MLRSLSTRWLLAVLAAVVVPFIGFAWYVNSALAHRLSWDVVRYYLLNLAADIADRVDDTIAERRLDIDLWAEDPIVEWSVGDYGGEEATFITLLQARFDTYVERGAAFEHLIAVDAAGRHVASNAVDPEGGLLAPALRRRLLEWDYSQEPWFELVMGGRAAKVDVHVPALIRGPDLPDRPEPRDCYLAFAAPVQGQDELGEVVGAVVGFLPWPYVERAVLGAKRRSYFQGIIGADLYSSSYAWLWGADGNTILAHPRPELFWTRVDGPPVNLPSLTAAANSGEWGMYPEYEFGGERKNAAFRRTQPPAAGGFHWVVGIGIDNEDIYATVNELRDLLVKATALVLLLVLSWTILIARRTTRPILALQAHTRRVAAGDLQARIDVRTRDELGELARDFNHMTEELERSREQLVRAEKEAAWREMARQVAHEIKNPLTPIKLSADLLRRARDEGSPQFDAIFDRTLDLIGRQVENMRQIAGDFYAFAGAHRLEPRPTDLRRLMEEVLELVAAWAAELGVRARAEGAEDLIANVDPGELRRVLINLVTNSLEAMPAGGNLELVLQEDGEGPTGHFTLEVRDDGVGLDQDQRDLLFQPHFTTKSHGTGLGLAVCKRVVEQMGGEIALLARPGGGTVARVRLPMGQVEGVA
jgi:signal transduction histidine kinase